MKYIIISMLFFALFSCSRRKITGPASTASGARSGTYVMNISKLGYQSILILGNGGNWFAEDSINGIKVREQSGSYYVNSSQSPEVVVIDKILIYYDIMKPSGSTDFIRNPITSLKAEWYCDNNGSLVIDSEYGYFYKKK